MVRQDWISHGIRVTHTLTKFTGTSVHRGRSREDVVRLHFGLRGDYRVTYPSLRRSYDLIGGHHNIFYAPAFEMEFINKTALIETFGVQFPASQFVSYADSTNDALSQFCAQVRQGQPGMLFEQWSGMTPALEGVIREVIDCRFAGGLRDLFILSKSIELLTLAIDATTVPANGLYLKTTADRERIVAARDHLNQRLSNPPSLAELSRLVGVNEFKLKRGFKEMFGRTVFSYLTTQRLELARRHLLDRDKTAAEVAFEMGYATPQHFHVAFKKHFGVTPNSIRKTP